MPKLIRPLHPVLTVLHITGLAGIAICLNEVRPGKTPAGWVPQHWVWPLLIASLVVVIGCTVHQVRGLINKRSSTAPGAPKPTPRAEHVSAAPTRMPQWLKWGLLGCAVVFALVVSSKIADRIKLVNSEPFKDAKSLVEKNIELSASLGTPLDHESPVGFVDANESTGIASLNFVVSGPLGKGRVFVEAVKAADTAHQWKLTRVDVYEEKSRRHMELVPRTRR